MPRKTWAPSGRQENVEDIRTEEGEKVEEAEEEVLEMEVEMGSDMRRFTQQTRTLTKTLHTA